MNIRRLLYAAVGCTILGVLTGMVLQLTTTPVPKSVGKYSFYATDFNLTLLGFLKNNSIVLSIVVMGMGVITGLTLFLIGIPLGLRLFSDPFLFLILPHGIFELVSLWLAGAAGFFLPVGGVSYCLQNREKVLYDEEIKQLARLIFAAGVLMIFAAVLETTVTRWIADIVVMTPPKQNTIYFIYYMYIQIYGELDFRHRRCPLHTVPF